MQDSIQKGAHVRQRGGQPKQGLLQKGFQDGSAKTSQMPGL